MKIILKQGRICNGDKIITIETKGAEAFSHSKLMTLINQLSKNEYLVYKDGKWDEKGKEFLFPLAVNEAIELGKKGIDFLDENHERELKMFCKKHYLKFEDFRQSRLDTFFKA